MIIDILVSSFFFIWIPLLLVYGHYKYFIYFSVRSSLESDVCKRQILTYKDDPHTERVKDIFVSFQLDTHQLLGI